MSHMSRTLIDGLKKKLQNMALGLTGKSFHICEIPRKDSDLGYTLKGNQIFIGFEHTMMDEMTEAEQLVFSEGVFAHELMHQMATDFDTATETADRQNIYWRQIFWNMFNVMEDPAIEYLAPNFFGGLLLRALHFTVARCYENAEPIDPEGSATMQFMNALIHYGDGGFIKGSITNTDAHDVFCKVIPIFDKAITEPNGAKRVYYAEEAFNIAKPLWEEEIKNTDDYNKLMQEMNELMKSAGKSIDQDGDGSSSDLFDPEDCEPDASSEKKMMRRKMSREMSVDASPLDSEPAGDSGDKTSETKSEKSTDDAERVDDTSEGTDTSKDDDASDAKGTSSSTDSGDHPTGKPETAKESRETEASHEDLMVNDDYTLSPEELEAASHEVSECISDATIEDLKSSVAEGLIDPGEMGKTYPGISCINLNMDIEDHSDALLRAYNKTVAQLSGGIQHLTKQLDRIFKNNQEERVYRQNGKVNVKRLQQARMTSRVFTKRKDPNKADMSVLLVVDASGSMSVGKRMEMSKQAVIGLAEVFHNLNIPVKAISFTGERNIPGKGYFDVIHRHYLNWKNDLNQRASLLTLNPEAENFDGFSIRYAGQVIKKRKEEHKLVIVISDGQPCCSYYHRINGVADTKNAIREVSKYATVIGVAIGADKNVLYEMYGRHFVDINNISMLFEQLGGVIKKEVSSW